MAVLRAVVVLLSLIAVSIFYTDILEDELINQDTAETQSETDVSHEDFFEYQMLTAEYGSFETPNYPSAGHNVDFKWLISVSKGNAIRLVIHEFDTEGGFDFIFVHDGISTDHPILMVYSGGNVPPVIRSTSNQMLVRFVTDNKITSQGFQANYFSIPPCYSVSHGSSGLIKSPNYPHPYDNNMICDWLIRVGEDERILFEFLDVDTEKYYDLIQIYDGDNDRAPFLRRISGDKGDEPLVQVSVSNVALVRFSTDQSVTGKGFLANYKAGSDLELAVYYLTEYTDLLNDSNPIGKVKEGDSEPVAFESIVKQVIESGMNALTSEPSKINNYTASTV